MKASAVLLRWYKSFNINYLGYEDRQPNVTLRPWNGLTAPSPTAFRFIEIPLREEITTIVGGNESGKSHLLSALKKVITGEGIPDEDGTLSPFDVTDLCHYSSIRDKNAAAWPNVGATFSNVSAAECAKLLEVAGQKADGETSSEITLILAHSEKQEAVLYFGRSVPEVSLNANQLNKVRELLPKIEFIRSDVPLAGEIPIDDLLAGHSETTAQYTPFGLAQEAARLLVSLTFGEKNAVDDEQAELVTGLAARLNAKDDSHLTKGERKLAVQLFRDVLGIDGPTVELLAEVKPKDRGFAEGLVATWNQELDRKLNLRRFWQQDDQFSLSLDFKGGWFYFEIRDKTGSVYTFRERSSGLRYFLSYYIQAKSIESRIKGGKCIILMDEPDSFLSISGQKNLLAVFESLVAPSQGNRNLQLIYTTHSPFLINPNYPHRIRLVRKGDAEEGSQHIPESRLRRYEPVRSALGIDCAQTLFMGESNLLLEGPSDQFLLIELIRFFAELRSSPPLLDLSSTIVMSAESAPGVAKILDASKWGDERIPSTVVLFDSDDEGDIQRKRITGKAKLEKLIDEKFVVLIGEAVNSVTQGHAIMTTEDLVTAPLFGAAVEKYIAKWFPEQFAENSEKIHSRVAAATFGTKGNAADTKLLFNDFVFKTPNTEKPREYDKMGVLHVVIDELVRNTKADNELSEIERRLTVLLIYLRRRIEESRYESQKLSAKQAIVRSIDDFFKRFKTSAEPFEVELQLDRVSREIRSIGDDAAKLSKILEALYKEIRETRTTGQRTIEKGDWNRWSSLIYAIKKNALDPEITIDAGRAEPVHLWQGTASPETAETVSSSENTMKSNNAVAADKAAK